MTRWLAILLLLVAAALVYTVVRQRSGDDTRSVSAEPREITPRGDLADDENSTIQLFKKSSPSVVHITSIETRRSRFDLNVTEIPQGTGTGFIWDSNGHIVTNCHVVATATHAEVTLSDNTVWRAAIVGSACDNDLAVLKIEAPADKLPPMAVGTSADLEVGQKVFAIGNPFGLDQTLTTGVISGLGREIMSVSRRPIYGVIQTDAAINPGNSGGPLLDSHGRIIGINTAIYSPSGASAGIGFAVPIDAVNRVVPQLIAHGKVMRPGLGIVIIEDRLAARLRIKGVMIAKAPPGSAAAKAGLHGVSIGPTGEEVWGDVIVAIDDQAVTSSTDLYRALDSKQVGDAMRLKINRLGQQLDVDVTLQALPDKP
jgi:S1-C subfamily serine protease